MQNGSPLLILVYSTLIYHAKTCQSYYLIWLAFALMKALKKVIFCLKNAFWPNNPKTKSLFTKSSLKITVQFLIENSHFTVGDVILLQTVDIPMGIGPVPFWGNLYSYNYKSKSINK